MPPYRRAESPRKPEPRGGAGGGGDAGRGDPQVGCAGSLQGDGKVPPSVPGRRSSLEEWFAESFLERQAPGEGKERGFQRGLGGASSPPSAFLGRGGQGEGGRLGGGSGSDGGIWAVWERKPGCAEQLSLSAGNSFIECVFLNLKTHSFGVFVKIVRGLL